MVNNMAAGFVILFKCVVITWTISNTGVTSYLTTQNDRQTSKHLILQPSRIKDGNSSVIVIFPETGVMPTAYVTLGKLLQNSSALKLWIVIVNSGGTTIEISDVFYAVTDVTRVFKNVFGITEKLSIFLCGHGNTGYLVQEYADLNPGDVSGLILYGSHLRTRQFYGSFPVPVLTLCGALDGVTRVSKIAQLYQYLLEETGNDVMLMVKSPIIVLQNVNHATFIDVPLPEDLKSMDIQIDKQQLERRQLIANLTMYFVLNTIGIPGISNSVSMFILKEIMKTEEIVQPFITLQRLTQDNNLKSTWVKYVQIWMSGIEGNQASKLQVDSYTYRKVDFAPRLFVNEESREISTYSRVIQSAASRDNASAPQAPIQINSRLIDSEMLHSSLGILDQLNRSRSRTCADMNYASYLTAYNMASRSARQRYDQTDPGFIFHDDIEVSTEDEWENRELIFSNVGTVVHVRAFSWKSSPYNRDNGVIYCTLLPPTRALEWIYIDSLKL